MANVSDGYTYPMAASTTLPAPLNQPKATQVGMQMTMLGTAIEVLEKDIAGLVDTLSPILFSETPTPNQTPEPARPPLCPLAEHMFNMAMRVQSLQERIQRTRRDVQV